MSSPYPTVDRSQASNTREYLSVITPLQTVINDTVVVSNWIYCDCVGRNQNILQKWIRTVIRHVIILHSGAVRFVDDISGKVL
jgi:nicotinamide riboside kinase